MFSKQPLFCCICGEKFEASLIDSWHSFEKAVCGEKCFYEKRRRESLSILNQVFTLYEKKHSSMDKK